MVRRVFQVVYKEVRGLHQAAYVLGAFAFGSQLLALVRDRLLAHQFGAGIELDLYYAAFRIPDLLYVLFASTLSVYVLIPFVATRMKGDDASLARNLLSQVFSVFLVVYSVLAVIILVLLPSLIPLLFPGMVEHTNTLVTLTSILLLQPFFLGLSSLFGVVTQLRHRFVLYAISPLIYNVGIIIGVGAFYPVMGLHGLTLGVVLGAFGHLAVQVPLVRSTDLSFGIVRAIDWAGMARIFYVSVPRAVTLAMQQATLLIFVSIASLMTVGSVSVFQFAFNLQSVPLAVIGASYSIAAFPKLADLFAQKRMEEFRNHIITALRHIIFWSVPAIGLIVVLRAQIVRVILGSGAFNWSDTRLTAAVLALLVISLFAQAINLLVVRAFYAGGFTRLPFFVTLIGSVFAVAFSFTLFTLYTTVPSVSAPLDIFMRTVGVPGSEVMVLGIAYSAAVILQMVVLLIGIVVTFKVPMRWFFVHALRAVLASVMGGSTAYVALNFLVSGVNAETFVGIFLQGFLSGVAGIVGVVMTYYVLRSPELREIARSFHGRLLKTDVVAPQEDVL